MFWYLATLLFFGSMEAVSRPLLRYFEPNALTFSRFLVGGLFLFVFGLVTRGTAGYRRLRPRTLGALALLGIINITFSMTLLQFAVQFSGAALAASVFCANPVFVLLIATALGMESLTLQRTFAVLLGVLGVFIVLNPFAAMSSSFVLGALCAIGAASLFALYSVLAKRLIAEVHPVEANVVSFAFGTVALGVCSFLAGYSLAPWPAVLASTEAILQFLFLSVGVSGVAYLTFFKMLEEYKASGAGMVFLAKPVFASVLAFFTLGEPLGYHVFAGALVVGVSGLMSVHRI